LSCLDDYFQISTKIGVFQQNGLLAAVSRIAAILPNDLAPTNMTGPLRTLNCLPSCRGAALRTGLSLQLQN
jgi:hypothetical protein